MNHLEKQMVELLNDLRENYHVTGVKAEFEAEGTRMEEAMRLKEVSMAAGLDMTIKVGGCEAIKDMFEAGSLGVAHIIAPMVESAYALKKYLGAVEIAFRPEDQEETEFFINLETITACKNFDEMLALPELHKLDGIVIGRSDLTRSMGLTTEDINDPRVLELALDAARKAKAKGLKVIVGGGVSVHSIPFFKAFPAGHLDYFETRKIVFSCPGAINNPEAAFLKAVNFELMWLKNKQNFYGAIHREDDVRMAIMEERYRKAIEAVELNKTIPAAYDKVAK